ncbi:MAG: hypothetical protein LBF24_00390 [Puniceicoccales bacterium]|nr:hypothetical protein [Puniceicoccales bacterium]
MADKASLHVSGSATYVFGKCHKHYFLRNCRQPITDERIAKEVAKTVVGLQSQVRLTYLLHKITKGIVISTGGLFAVGYLLRKNEIPAAAE